MKHLLLFLLCQGSLDGFSQTATVCYKHNLISTAKCSYCAEVVRYDTLASHLLITHNPPSFTHSIEGYCVTSFGYCTGKHLVYRSSRNWFFGRRRWSFIVVGSEYDVWGCKRKEGGG